MSARYRLTAVIAAAVAYLGIMFILSTTVGRAIGHGWQYALIPFEFAGGYALGTFGAAYVMAAR